MGGAESVQAGGDASIDVDQIKFGKKLGSGSFGAVWKATWLDRTVAVKQFYNVDQRTYDREVAQLLGLSHPNIIQVYGAGGRGGDLYLVMEFAVDGSLYDTLHRPGQGKTAIPQAISWGLQCAKGVAYLHSQSVVHRDLKPHNSLLFNGKTVLKICDFGTARDVVLSEGKGPGGLSQSMTQSVGTPLYIAPEVWLGRHYSEKCDVYSWAIMMWEILTCKMPYADFGIDTMEELKQAKKSGKTPAPVRGLPDRLDSVIKSAWAYDPSDRPTMARVVQIMGAI